MALTLTKRTLQQTLLVKDCFRFYVASAVWRTAILSDYNEEEICGKKLQSPTAAEVCHKQYQISSRHCFSTGVEIESLCWGGSSYELLSRKLEIALKDHKIYEAWELFTDFKKLYGLPEGNILNRLITVLSYSSEKSWLRKASDLVILIWREKPSLLHTDVLTKLSLSLARSQLPVPTSKIVRIMFEMKRLLPMNFLQPVVLHMVKTEIGAYLASNILVQICDCCLQPNENKGSLMKPNTVIFNLLLDACVRFKLSIKGHQIMELMAQMGVVADAHSIVIIAQIHHMNGQRDEIKKFKKHVDIVLPMYYCHYLQFYDSLLSLHFKFRDIDSATELVLDLCKYPEALPIQKDPQKSGVVRIGPTNLIKGLKLLINPELLNDSVLQAEGKQGLLVSRNGKLLLSNKAIANLIVGYKREGKIMDLSKLLLNIERGLLSLGGCDLCCHVVNAFIQLGWLEIAHDILDDMEMAGAPLNSSVYMLLLKAYHSRNMVREANALLKQMSKAGLVPDMAEQMIVSGRLSDVDVGAFCSSASTLGGEYSLAESLVREVEEAEDLCLIYELNSAIYFFCKSTMMSDALNTYKRMQQMSIRPTVQTFAYLASGFLSMEKLRDVTILWGDIKRNMQSGSLAASRDLYELLLMIFLRGGYFERVMEVIGYMEKDNMYQDKWMYRREFLKFHKNLYRSLKTSEAKNEAQMKRLEHVKAFKRWVRDN